MCIYKCMISTYMQYTYIYISSIYLSFFSNEEIKLIWIQDASKFASSNDLGMTTC